VGDAVSVAPLADGADRPATVHSVDEARDAAVLVCDVPLEGSAGGLVATDSVVPGTDVAISGVAQIDDEKALRYGSTSGHWQGSALREDGVALGQLTAPGLVKGMSGAPVCRVGDNGVLGMVSARYNSADQWLRNWVWVIRTEDLRPMMAGVQEDPPSLALAVADRLATAPNLLNSLMNDLETIHGDYLFMFESLLRRAPDAWEAGLPVSAARVRAVAADLREIRLRYEPLRVRVRALGEALANSELPPAERAFVAQVVDYFPSGELSMFNEEKTNRRGVPTSSTAVLYRLLDEQLGTRLPELIEQTLTKHRTRWDLVCAAWARLQVAP
jgi:hypothetical protein